MTEARDALAVGQAFPTPRYVVAAALGWAFATFMGASDPAISAVWWVGVWWAADVARWAWGRTR